MKILTITTVGKDKSVTGRCIISTLKEKPPEFDREKIGIRELGQAAEFLLIPKQEHSSSGGGK